MIPLWVSKVASRVDLLLPQPDDKQSLSSCTCRSSSIPKGLFRCLVSSSNLRGSQSAGASVGVGEHTLTR